MDGLSWRIPLQVLLTSFQEVTRGHQIFILQPTMMAMIYAVNLKPSCFTGFTQIRPPGPNYNYLNFLAAQALAGPGSVTTCLL